MNTPTPLSREELNKMIVKWLDGIKIPGATVVTGDLTEQISMRVNQSLKAFADEVEREVIETSKAVIYNKGAKPMGWKEQTDFYCKAREDLREEQKSALKALLEKWGI